MDSYQIYGFTWEPSLNDGNAATTAEEAVNEYLKMCKYNIPPEKVPQKYTRFYPVIDSNIVIYQDICRKKDSYRMIMVGKFTPDIVERIKDGLNALYTTKCHECEKALSSKNVYDSDD